MEPTRRSVLKAAVVSAAVGAPGAGLMDSRASAASLPLLLNPFTLGVASGDPVPDGFVIWTRLAISPLTDDGFGGMPDSSYDVDWQVATDPRFFTVVTSGTESISRETAHSVHVEVAGLLPAREYWYRFRAGDWMSQVGHAITAPDAGAMPSSLRMAQVSCAQYAEGYFSVYRRLAETNPDLVVHLGDYIYEFGNYAGALRPYAGASCFTLADYRRRYAQYKTDRDLQFAHATAPFVCVFDDHEVENNWADTHPPGYEPGFMTRRANAFRAYWENMPMRRPQVPVGYNMQLYRRLVWGRLANIHLMDTRQFRDDQACGDGYKVCSTASAATRTITGAAQERWLLDGFRASVATWDILAQQVFFGQRDTDSGAAKRTSMDAWDGYTASRYRITKGWYDAGVRNAVVLTGDVHSAWANELKLTYDRPATNVGVELVATSVTSAGDGYDNSGNHPWMQWNPDLRYFNNLRGWISTTYTPQHLTADYQVVAKVSQPNEPSWLKARFVVEDGVAKLNRTYLAPMRNTGARTGPHDEAADVIAQETDPTP
ncbi:MAG: alkaline phosphatase D family protein [Actinomycetota bacterium]|nr:alkaline phosphatase D family protein [Actinomycetota bacterium]